MECIGFSVSGMMNKRAILQTTSWGEEVVARPKVTDFLVFTQLMLHLKMDAKAATILNL